MNSKAASGTIDKRALSRLKWRCRRGMLENDLFVQRFFERHEAGLTERQAAGLGQLMELSDNDLLDLLLARGMAGSGPEGTEAREVLAMMRLAMRAASTGPGMSPMT
jgi:succinate dehydrogenase flavin-adding protein (antitoxin of CptAB toxin-antitoxin module)